MMYELVVHCIICMYMFRMRLYIRATVSQWPGHVTVIVTAVGSIPTRVNGLYSFPRSSKKT